MKIIFIGDSHLGMMKSSTYVVPERWELEFYAHASGENANMGMLEIKDNCLIPTNNSLKLHLKKFFKRTEIDISDSDVVVLVGLRLQLPYYLYGDRGYSEQLIKESMQDIVMYQSITYQLAQKIRQIAKNVAIVVIPNPLITTHLQTNIIPSAPGMYPKFKYGNITSWPDDALSLWEVTLENVFKNLGVHFVRQNKNTIIDDIFTKPEFAFDPALMSSGITHTSIGFWQYVWNDLVVLIHGIEND